jgi:hypothetical protein
VRRAGFSFGAEGCAGGAAALGALGEGCGAPALEGAATWEEAASEAALGEGALGEGALAEAPALAGEGAVADEEALAEAGEGAPRSAKAAAKTAAIATATDAAIHATRGPAVDLLDAGTGDERSANGGGGEPTSVGEIGRERALWAAVANDGTTTSPDAKGAIASASSDTV